MSEITTKLVLDGITLALRSEYPNSKIMADSVDQGLTAPAFIVLLPSADSARQPNNRWRKRTRFDVIYFPTVGREECYDVADNLAQVLDVITLPSGDKLRGSDVNFTVDDDVLHFFISYNYFAYEENAEESMETLTLE